MALTDASFAFSLICPAVKMIGAGSGGYIPCQPDAPRTALRMSRSSIVLFLEFGDLFASPLTQLQYQYWVKRN
jgi:hypothetical protein